ncbi:MAG: 4Fe-4S binding protein [bacterium]
MNKPDPYAELAAKIQFGHSERIRKLWEMLCDEDEARLLLAMPGTAEELAAKTGRPAAEAAGMIDVLFKKGVAFESRSGWKMSRNFVQFHDATILWREAPGEFLDLWKDFIDNEYPQVVEFLKTAGMKPFMRVIPVHRSVEAAAHVLPYENAARMIADAHALAVTKCTCRMTQRACGSPLEVCLQINRGAEYAVKRGSGRGVTKEEALEILRISEEAGLVHLADNRPEAGHVLCNCCPCCCQVMEPLVKAGARAIVAPSRFLAEVDAGTCTACGECADRCHLGAVKVNDAALVDAALCIGCGLCMTVCPSESISMKEIRDTGFIGS